MATGDRRGHLPKLDIDAAGAAAVAGATPLADNGYKVPILKQLVRRALTERAS